MLFSSDILKSKRKDIKETVIKISDRSLFIESLSYLIESNKNFYKIISEADNNDQTDFDKAKQILSDIVASFTRGIEETYIKFYKQILEIHNNESEKIEDLEALQSLNNENEFRFKMDRFKYTNLDILESYSSFKTDLLLFINRLVVYSQKLLCPVKNIDEYRLTVSTIENEKRNAESEIDSIRGKLLNYNGYISKEEFESKIFLYFRPLHVEANSIIDSKELEEIRLSYNAINVSLKIVESDKNRLLNNIEEAQKIFNNLNIDFNNYGDFKFDELTIDCIKNISYILDIYLLLFSARLDAITSNYKTNISILKEALEYLKSKEI